MAGAKEASPVRYSRHCRSALTTFPSRIIYLNSQRLVLSFDRPMESTSPAPAALGQFESEMAVLKDLAEKLNDQSLPLDQLAPLIERALSQATRCEQLLTTEEGRVTAELRQHEAMLNKLRVVRW